MDVREIQLDSYRADEITVESRQDDPGVIVITARNSHSFACHHVSRPPRAERTAYVFKHGWLHLYHFSKSASPLPDLGPITAAELQLVRKLETQEGLLYSVLELPEFFDWCKRNEISNVALKSAFDGIVDKDDKEENGGAQEQKSGGQGNQGSPGPKLYLTGHQPAEPFSLGDLAAAESFKGFVLSDHLVFSPPLPPQLPPPPPE